jgi:hypothetical protein
MDWGLLVLLRDLEVKYEFLEISLWSLVFFKVFYGSQETSPPFFPSLLKTLLCLALGFLDIYKNICYSCSYGKTEGLRYDWNCSVTGEQWHLFILKDIHVFWSVCTSVYLWWTILKQNAWLKANTLVELELFISDHVNKFCHIPLIFSYTG